MLHIIHYHQELCAQLSQLPILLSLRRIVFAHPNRETSLFSFPFSFTRSPFVFVFSRFCFHYFYVKLRFCFAVVRFYFQCARSFIIKLFVLNIKKINSRHMIRVCEFAFSYCRVVVAAKCTETEPSQFEYFYVLLNVRAFAFTQIASNMHDNQACTCPLIHYNTIATQKHQMRAPFLLVLHFRTDHLGFFFSWPWCI